MNLIKTNKEFNKFFEIYEWIIITESSLNNFDYNPEEWEFPINKLIFICLKHSLYDADELENLSTSDYTAVINFCSELKERICNDFIDKINNC